MAEEAECKAKVKAATNTAQVAADKMQVGADAAKVAADKAKEDLGQVQAEGLAT